MYASSLNGSVLVVVFVLINTTIALQSDMTNALELLFNMAILRD